MKYKTHTPEGESGDTAESVPYHLGVNLEDYRPRCDFNPFSQTLQEDWASATTGWQVLPPLETIDPDTHGGKLMKSVKLIAMKCGDYEGIDYWVGKDLQPPDYPSIGPIIKIYLKESYDGYGDVRIVCDFGEDIGIEEIIYPHCRVLYYILQEEPS